MKSQGKVNGTIRKMERVFVGLSGGVDSSVSAALLKKATPNNFAKLFGRPTPEGFRGYDVTGVFIKVWQPDFVECTWREDRLDAMRVCAKLEIPFITLDLSKEYKKEVVDYMVAEYKAGRTPNPDVMCNKYVKFGGFFKWAMEQGADYVATGHYARNAELRRTNADRRGRIFQLLDGVDKNKDQSYFLWTLTQEQLSHTLFPVGGLEKPEVRKLAKKFGLPTADKKDSQGLCFIGKIDVKDFLKSFIKSEKGSVLDEKGKVVGTHDGAMFFTLGERHCFRITRIHADRNADKRGLNSQKNTDVLSAKIRVLNQQQSADMRPYYVVAKDIQKNTLTVSHKSPEGVLANAVTGVCLKDCNWVSGKPPVSEKIYSVRCRYRQPLFKARIMNKTKFIVQFDEPQSAITPGQSIVLYDGDVCLGGGIIE
jgi:tRNA-specific 2-thiouridylase